MNISSEHSEQVGFVNWWRNKFPDIIIFAIANGGKRDMTTAKRLKDEGVLRGIPDLMIPSMGIFIEMKRTHGGRLSDEQTEMISYLERVGYTCIVAAGAEDASRKILEMRRKIE